MSILRTYFFRGDYQRIADEAGCSRATISNLFKNKSRLSPLLAKKVTHAARDMGIDLDLMDCLYPEDSDNPLFEEKGATQNDQHSE